MKPVERCPAATHSTLRGLAVILALLLCGALRGAAGERVDSLVLLPGDFTLRGPDARVHLVVEQVRDGEFIGPAESAAEILSSDPSIVRVEAGLALPVANGVARLTARHGELTVSVNVQVIDVERPTPWSFRNHVQSVLAKSGCSMGACHGAAAGKNGFKLSLRGYDPAGDFLALTRQSRGRRVVPSDPGRSLLLLKPTAAVPHRGGRRFDVGSLEYRVLAEWIAAGTPAPSDADPRIVRLEVLPEQCVLRPGVRQQLIVRAHFSDGAVEDVTPWVKFTSTNEAVAQVDDTGNIQVMGPGEGAFTAWYLSQIVIARVSVPYEGAEDPAVFAAAERHNLIDDLVLAKLARLNLVPSPPVADHEFMRRAYLDTLGVLPKGEEVRAFLQDASPDKRAWLIDALLARPEFVDYWTYRWSDLLLVNTETLSPGAMWSFHHWIRNHVAANTPWDQVVRQLLTAQGHTLENGAANFFALHPDPLDLAETTTVAFLGTSINCARCHNHPLEKWTNDQYYAMVNLFGRVRTKTLSGDAERVVFDAAEGDVIQPLTGRPQPPTPLDGVPLADSAASRREYLAAWLTSDDNPAFARALVNRVWANFLGVGLVEKVDDMRISNPASNEALLAALAAHLVEQRYDLRVLVRLILNSATYQRSSQPLPENLTDTRFYARYYPRRLMAEVLLDALSEVTGVPSEFADYPPGWRALELPDSKVPSYFLKTFGRPERAITCDCERTAEPSMTQVLHLANGDAVNKKLSAAGNRIEQWLGQGWTDEQIVDALYWSALSREPAVEERSRLVAILAEGPPEERRLRIEDLFWGVLSSQEFLFNH